MFKLRDKITDLRGFLLLLEVSVGPTAISAGEWREYVMSLTETWVITTASRWDETRESLEKVDVLGSPSGNIINAPWRRGERKK